MIVLSLMFDNKLISLRKVLSRLSKQKGVCCVISRGLDLFGEIMETTTPWSASADYTIVQASTSQLLQCSPFCAKSKSCSRPKTEQNKNYVKQLENVYHMYVQYVKLKI